MENTLTDHASGASRTEDASLHLRRLERLASRRPIAVALVACGKSKTTTRAKARELYTGGLFRAALEHAIATADLVFIVSAKHGLVAMDDELDPYDHKLAPRDAHAWARRVASELARRVPFRTQITVHAGATYADALATTTCGRTIEPCRGMTIGQRLAFYKAQKDHRARVAAFVDAGGSGLVRGTRHQLSLFGAAS